MRSQHCKNTMKPAHHGQSECTSIAYCCVKVQSAYPELDIRQVAVEATERSESVGEARGHARKSIPALVLDAFQAVLLPIQHSVSHMPGASYAMNSCAGDDHSSSGGVLNHAIRSARRVQNTGVSMPAIQTFMTTQLAQPARLGPHRFLRVNSRRSRSFRACSGSTSSSSFFL